MASCGLLIFRRLCWVAFQEQSLLICLHKGQCGNLLKFCMVISISNQSRLMCGCRDQHSLIDNNVSALLVPFHCYVCLGAKNGQLWPNERHCPRLRSASRTGKYSIDDLYNSHLWGISYEVVQIGVQDSITKNLIN